MCGIAGICNSKITVSDKLVKKKLSHRGPDIQEYWRSDKVQLWHSRLSILDLDERSNQPFIDFTGRYVLVYNGEIYNYNQLKSSLSVTWRTTSDTELVMEWLKAYGTSRLDELEGMFAFAFYDTQEDTCILARDRFGKKPLYLYQTDGSCSFASEIRVLLAMHPELSITTKQQLSNWLFWQTIPGTETLISGISQLEPGGYLNFQGGKATRGVFVRWQQPEIKPVSGIDVVTTTKQLVTEAVNKRLVADVPFAAFLSGGVDSSIITAVASQAIGSSLNTFTVSFDESEFSEHRIAAEVARRYNTQHHEIRLKPIDFLAQIEEGLSATDHPSGDGLNTYVVSKYTRAAGFKMALSGIGGDEWFLGYNYFSALDAWRRRRYLGWFGSWSGLLPFRYRKAVEIVSHIDQGAAAYGYQRLLFDSTTISSVFNLPSPTIGPLQAIWPDTMSARSAEEWRYYTQPVLLRDTDQYSMAVGLELRAPFMDQNLVNFALSLPDDVKRGNRSKYLLVEAFKDMLPESVYNRKKQGFTLPWEQWMRKELQDFCRARIVSFSNRLEAPALIVEWNKFIQHKSSWSWSRFWSIVALEDYLQRLEISIR